MTTLQWTERAQADLAAIRAFIEADSPHYAGVTVSRILHAVGRLQDFPQSGRVVPEYVDPAVREVVLRPYRIVYRIVGADDIHVLTVHHGARGEIRGL
ncbi:MAG: type II toxin-antitoxin system RelE/ParE family toxin [Acidobacteria bacterium]|nr:type II toxin-antitoxin system RelE/ParE family toxin [Acidobacteriota bacterium]